MLDACPQLTILAISREPIGVAGELTWRVPSLSLADEAIELFADRARRARPDFRATDDNSATTADERYQVIDQLSLLVDKSLVVADDVSGTMRYRLLETVRQYALEKLGESGEADAVRDRHRDYYTATAAMLESGVQAVGEWLMDWAEVEIDNLRAAFAWSCENTDVEIALRPASSLQPFWIARARLREGLALFDTAVTDAPGPGVAPAVWVRAVTQLARRAGGTPCRNARSSSESSTRCLRPYWLVVSSSRPAGGPTTPSR
jgi:predicted ATPase